MEHHQQSHGKPLRDKVRDKAAEVYRAYVQSNDGVSSVASSSATGGHRDGKDTFERTTTAGNDAHTHTAAHVHNSVSNSANASSNASSNASAHTSQTSANNSSNRTSQTQSTIMSDQQSAEQLNSQEQHEQTQDSSAELAHLQERVEKLQAERDEYREQAIRKIAELENFRRRSDQERKEFIDYANQKLLLQLLPMMDDFERVIDAMQKGGDLKSLLEGVELVYAKSKQTFTDAGAKRMKTVGEMFDVRFHEALMQMPSEAEEGKIVQEVQAGYMLGDKVLRHAKVITSAGAPA